PTLGDRLQDRTKRECVGRGVQMDRPAQGRDADGASFLDQPRELGRVEALEARTHTDVRILRHLGLHADEPLDGPRRRHGLTREEHLAREQRAVQLATGEDARGRRQLSAAAFFSWPNARSRSCFASTRLRRRNVFGVTSSSSSSARNSIASSSESVRIPSSFAAMSELLLRMFVRCFFLQTLISRSRSRMCWPTIIPSYTSMPGPMKRVPRS